MTRRAVAAIGSGPMVPMSALSLQTSRPYAARHGYDLVVGAGDSLGRPPASAKVLLARRLFDVYDEVVWLGADTIILDGSQDLAEDIGQECF